MHFSHALVTALTVIATQTSALPLRNAAGPSSGMQARGVNAWQQGTIDTLASRGVDVDAARESVGVFARYADVKDDHERSLFIARDLSKRGILDMLVAALRDIVVELLGKSGTARKRDADQTTNQLQQLTGLNFSTPSEARASWSQMLDALSKALEQESKTLKQQANVNGTASASGEKAKGTATSVKSQVSASAIPSGSAAASASASPSATAAGAADRKVETPRQGNKAAKRAIDQDAIVMELAARQEEGVEGLLQVLRNLVDAILNTLLPMSSRSEDSGSESSSSSSKSCPPAGTPNDGMYRPGCPGYGRREVTDALLQVRDAASSSQELSELMPLLEELIQRLPEMMGGGISSSTSANSTNASASTQAPHASTSAAASSDGSASTSTRHDSAAPMSAAKLSINTRSLLEADGFELEKRQSSNSLANAITQLVDDLLEGLLGTENNSTDTTGATGAAKKDKDLSDDSSSSSSGSNSNSLLMSLMSSLNKRDGGLNLDLLNNLLGNLLSGSGSSQSSNLNNDGSANGDKRDGGLNLNLLNNLLGNLLSGSGSKQSSDSNNKRDGGLNLNLLNNLLGNLLSGDNASQSSDSNNKRDGGLNLNLLNNLLGNLLSGDNSAQSSNSNNKRADFQPVWTELKNLGNKQFASAHAERRDANSGFTPVWTSFRDMVDDAYAHGVQRRSPLPSPSPKVDTSAFTHAAANFVKQTIFKQHDRRAINGEQFQPLIHAAGSFAKSQMQEWTDALNEHSSKHGKIHA
ncbi:uncharacterized protein FA14DRAFT_18020 [Meira miltonrushii]|uniref:Uncharacterized protein n=1 Tax=Meira miltonrushii TaxID=1280837 RepID=A0A316VJ42_9BASI|nr:uncharacterized protein FA14DRAFT_18020 [Meira miltonrushii]PWN37697.1 hypothetical protein FA14DRAFT_18020 [Meira miltonrushii]